MLCFTPFYLANCSNPCGNCISCLSVDLCECFDGWTADNCCTGISKI